MVNMGNNGDIAQFLGHICLLVQRRISIATNNYLQCALIKSVILLARMTISHSARQKATHKLGWPPPHQTTVQ